MPFELQPATPADAPEMTDVFFKAFTNPFIRAAFPDTDNMRKWFIQMLSKSIEQMEAGESDEVFFKVVEVDDQQRNQQPRIAAFSQWKLPVQTASGSSRKTDKEEESESVWPEFCNQELCRRLFGILAARREKFMGDRPYLYLDTLATAPEYQGRGCASLLLKWGISRADEQGVELYLSASPVGRPIYEKYGFRVLDAEEIYPQYTETYMLRPSSRF